MDRRQFLLRSFTALIVCAVPTVLSEKLRKQEMINRMIRCSNEIYDKVQQGQYIPVSEGHRSNLFFDAGYLYSNV